MSKGLGKTQLAVMEAFSASPQKWLSVLNLAQYAFSSNAIGASELASVRRALVKVGPLMDLKCRRVQPAGRFGWENKYMQNSEFEAIFAAYDWTQPRKLNW